MNRVYRLEHREDGRGPFTRRDVPFADIDAAVYPGTRFRFCVLSSRWLPPMHRPGYKCAFHSEWALWCYFHEALAELVAAGYVVAQYDEAEVEESDGLQCLLPIDAMPLHVAHVSAVLGQVAA